MKRVLAIALSAAMLVSMMAGCSSNENSTETSTNTTEQTTEAPETTEEEAPAEEAASTDEETSSEIVAPEADVEMQYITVEDASANLESDDYTFIRCPQSGGLRCFPHSGRYLRRHGRCQKRRL